MPILLPRVNFKAVLWFLFPLVVFFISTWLEDLLTQIIHPYNIQLLNLTLQTNGLNAMIDHIDFIPILITLVVVGFTAWWAVNQSNNKIKDTKSELEETKEGAKRDIAAIYKQSTALQEKTRQQAIQENSIFWKEQIEEERDKHVVEVLELSNICKRLRDNLGQLDKEIMEKNYQENKAKGMHPIRNPLKADIILQEVSSDLIKEADALFEKYNL